MRDKRPQREEKKYNKKEPGPLTYKLDQKDERRILSIRKRSLDFKF